VIGDIRDAIGTLWVCFGDVWQVLITLWLVVHAMGELFQAIRYFLIRLWVAAFPLAVGLNPVWNRSKPLWNRVKEKLKWRFCFKNGTLTKGKVNVR